MLELWDGPATWVYDEPVGPESKDRSPLHARLGRFKVVGLQAQVLETLTLHGNP